VDPNSIGEGAGVLKSAFKPVAQWWRGRHPLNPLLVTVREEWRKGYAIRQKAQLAADTPQALNLLRQEAQAWAGDFHLRIRDEAPSLYDRYKDENKAVPTSLGDLRSAVGEDLALLRRFERDLRWPQAARLRWWLLGWRGH
jgi:hypothetical protein